MSLVGFQDFFQGGDGGGGGCPTITIEDPEGENIAFRGGEFGIGYPISGGDGPYTPNLVSGEVPDGTTLSVIDNEGTYFVYFPGVTTTFKKYSLSFTVTDGNGCVSDTKEIELEVWAEFQSNGPATIEGSFAMSTIPVADMPLKYGTGVVLDHAVINLTKSDLSTLIGIQLTDIWEEGTSSIYDNVGESLTGSNLTNTNIYNSGKPVLTDGTAPYTGDFMSNVSGASFNSLNTGAENMNGDWHMYFLSSVDEGTVDSVLLIFKPI